VPAARRSFEDFSPILSTSQIKKRKNRRIPGAYRSDIHREFKRMKYICLGKKESYVKKLINKIQTDQPWCRRHMLGVDEYGE
jgi:hypothetical protein